MTDTPETDAENERITESWSHNAGDYCKMLEFARKLERERDVAIAERDNALSDWRQADTDSIRALYERNEARDRLIDILKSVTAYKKDCKPRTIEKWEDEA